MFKSIIYLNKILSTRLMKAHEEKVIREKMKDERRERARLEGIIALQTTDMTPLSKAYYAGEKRKAIEYLSSRELFSSSSSETRQRELFPPSSNDYYPEMPTQTDQYSSDQDE